MKKKVKTIFCISCVFIVSVCGIITYLLNQDSKRLAKESKIYSTLDVTLENGTKIETEYFNFENKFFLKIPKDFSAMKEEIKNRKYPNGNVPDYVYTNKKTTVNIAVSITDTSMNDNQIEEYLKALKETFQNFEDVKTNTFLRDQRTIGEIEFVSKAVDIDIYNHMIVFSVDQKLVIATFNCTKKLQKDYKKLGDFVVDSIMFSIDKE